MEGVCRIICFSLSIHCAGLLKFRYLRKKCKQFQCKFKKKSKKLSFLSGDLHGHEVEVHIHHRGILVLAAATATLAPVVAPLASRQAHSPLNRVLLQSSVSRKRLKLPKLLQRPRPLAMHLLRPRAPHLLTSPAQSPITCLERGALPLHRNQRKVPELPRRATPSPPPISAPKGPLTIRPPGTKMARWRMTPYNGIKRNPQHQDRAKTRNGQMFFLILRYHHYRYPQHFLSTSIKERGMNVLLLTHGLFFNTWLSSLLYVLLSLLSAWRMAHSQERRRWRGSHVSFWLICLCPLNFLTPRLPHTALPRIKSVKHFAEDRSMTRHV